MKIILTSIGTRGDIEPFLAIGKILKEKGHQVICAFSEQFRELTENCDIEFASLGKKMMIYLKAMPVEQLWEDLELRNSLLISNLSNSHKSKKPHKKKNLSYTNLLNKKDQIE